MVAADVLFRTAANAAALVYAARPAYVSYRTHVEVDVPTYHRHKTIDRAVEERTAGDVAVIQDLPHGKRTYGHAFPLDPLFDALSYFELRFQGIREAYSWVQDVTPLSFASVTPREGISVVATTLRYYYATYADDSTDARPHVAMNPLRSLTHNNKSDFYLHDVWIDPATSLPARVLYVGPDTTFDVVYTTVQGHWIIDHVDYAKTLRGPLRIGSVSFTVHSQYGDYAFPATPADPNLTAPAVGATMSPLPQLTPQPK